MNSVDISNKVKDILNERLVGITAIGLDGRISLYHSLLEGFYQFTYNAIKAEREACAQIADEVKTELSSDVYGRNAAALCAKRIRNRND